MVVGITGGTGSGKTTVTGFLAEKGWKTINVDELAQDIIHADHTIRQQIRNRFGDQYFDDKGQLKKRALGEKVFSNSPVLQQLNEIVWPVLIPALKEKIDVYTHKSSKPLAVDMAIIFEANCQALFDVILLVVAPLIKRNKWLKTDRHWSSEEIKRRIECQTDDSEKIQKADYVIENDGQFDLLKKKTDAFIAWIENKALA